MQSRQLVLMQHVTTKEPYVDTYQVPGLALSLTCVNI